MLAIDTQGLARSAFGERTSDGQAVAAALAKAGSTQFDQVITRELAGPAATPAAIHDELEKLRSRMTIADTGIVYFAGQDAINAGGNYVLRSSTSAAGAAGEISTTEIQSQLGATAGHVALMLDLTRADQHAQRETSAGFCGSVEKEDGSAKLDAAAAEWLRELLTEDYGVVVISSRRSGTAQGAAVPGQKNNPAGQIGPAGQSPLTQAFTEAISGRADANHDGAVDLKELAPYADRTRPPHSTAES